MHVSKRFRHRDYDVLCGEVSGTFVIAVRATRVTQMAVVAFIIVGGLMLFQPGNMVPFAPMGVSGVIRGSSAAFFGYLGYDEVRVA